MVTVIIWFSCKRRIKSLSKNHVKSTTTLSSSGLQVFYRMTVLTNKFTGKHLRWSIFLVIGSDLFAGAFLWLLWHFLEQPFYRTSPASPGDFCSLIPLPNTKKDISKSWKKENILISDLQYFNLKKSSRQLS